MFISYLSASMTATQTTLEVPDGSIFPQNQVFDVWVDQEKMSCTSWASANVMNVQRGPAGTAHDAEELVAIDTEVKQNVRTSKSLDGHIANVTDMHGITFGIADNNIVQIDHASVADNDYAKFTATGLEGRSYSEVKTDLGAGAASGLATLNASTKVVEQPASISDHEGTIIALILVLGG